MAFPHHDSLLDQLFPHLDAALASVGTSLWLPFLLVLLAAVLLRRHNVITYGEHYAGLTAVPLGGLLLLGAPFPGYSIALGAAQLLLFVYLYELIQSIKGKEGGYVRLFSGGFFLGLLTVLHLGYLLLFLEVIRLMVTTRHATARHFAALGLGGIVPWWLSFALASTPGLDGACAYFRLHGEQLLSLSLPHTPAQIVYAATFFVCLLCTSLVVVLFLPDALERHRHFARSHLVLLWLFTLLYLLYGTACFALSVVFFTSLLMQVQIRRCRTPLGALLPLLPLGLLLVASFIAQDGTTLLGSIWKP